MESFEQSILKFEDYCREYNSLKEEVIIDIFNGNAPLSKRTDSVIVFSVTGKPIIPRSTNQLKLVEEFEKNDLVVAIGPAGSGKTYTAIALAVRALKNKEKKKIILCRPAVEAGEKLGFLPGDMRDKIDPYLQPLYDALEDMIPAAKLEEYMNTNIIQIAPLAFMLYQLETKTGVQTAVIVLPSIGDNDPLDFAYSLGRRWGVGKKKKDTGLVLLLVLDQRKIQFATGYGLEGDLPDAICKHIQMKVMVPAFRKNDWDTGM